MKQKIEEAKGKINRYYSDFIEKCLEVHGIDLTTIISDCVTAGYESRSDEIIELRRELDSIEEMNSDGNKILDAIKRMAADDNKGLIMTTTIVDVKDDPRGSIVGFGTEKVCGDDAFAQTMGLLGKYMACAFFIDREELKKYL